MMMEPDIGKIAMALLRAASETEAKRHSHIFTGRDFQRGMFQAMTRQGVINLLGRKWKNHIARLKIMVDFIAAYNPTDNATAREFTLSCNNARLGKALGLNYRQISNLISYAEKINLLICTNEIYSVRESAKGYIYNPAVADIIRSLHASIPAAKCVKDEQSTIGQDKAARRVDFKLTFGRVYSHADITDGDALQAVNNAYPWLPDYQAKIARLNERLEDYPLLQMSFNPTITRSKSGQISKIGIRCTSPFCSSATDGEREHILNTMIGGIHYDFDIKSSIYRVNYFMATGIWADNDVDFYALMPHDDFKGTRADYKAMAMLLYFNRTGAEIVNKINFRRMRAGLQVIPQCYRAGLADWLQAAIDKMDEVIGGRIGTAEIFLHESCIYADLLEYLLDKGIMICQCYDGFYSNQPIGEIIQAALPDIARRYRDRVMGVADEDNPTEKPLEAPASADGASPACVDGEAGNRPMTGQERAEFARLLDSIFPDEPQKTQSK